MLSTPLILLLHEDGPSRLWLPGPPPSRSYYLSGSDLFRTAEPEVWAAVANADYAWASACLANLTLGGTALGKWLPLGFRLRQKQ